MRSVKVNRYGRLLSFELNYIKWLPYHYLNSYYDLKFAAQYAFAPLTLQDQFTIGDRWNVRGFEGSSGISGDKGFYIRNTLNFITGFKNTELYLGADYGQISCCNTAQDEYDSKKILGGTAGLKGSNNELSYDFSLSSPLYYPQKMNTDKFTINFNLFCQL